MNGGHTGTRRRLLEIAGTLAGGSVATSLSAGARRREDGTEGDGDAGELVLGIDDTADVRSVKAAIKRAVPSQATIVCQDDELGCVTVAHSNISSVDDYDRHARLYERHDWCAYAEPNFLHYPMVTRAKQVGRSAVRHGRSRGRGSSRGKGRGNSGSSPTNSTDSLIDSQYAPRIVNAPAAWETTLGSTDVTIAVIDTGVENTHETLVDQFGDPIGIDFLSDQRNGRVPAGSSHGTSVAGIAAATTADEIGIAGISNARLLSVRALAGAGKADTIAMAIRWAADRSDIINMSFATDQPSETLRRACAYAARQDTLLVAPAGNKSKQDDLGPEGSRGVAYPTGSRGVVYPTGSRGVVYPTGSRGVVYPTGSRGVVYPTGSRGVVYPTGSRGVVYPTGSRGVVYPTDEESGPGAFPAGFDTVLSVSAIDRAEQPAAFTLGGDWVDLTAPGADVLSTARGDNYARVSGTSMSAPMVSGAAALAKTVDPQLSAEDLESLLTKTARPLGIDPDVEGAGCVDAAALVDALRR